MDDVIYRFLASRAAVALTPWPAGPFNRLIEEKRCVRLLVRDNNVDQANPG